MLSGSKHVFELQQMSNAAECDKNPVHAYGAVVTYATSAHYGVRCLWSDC
jgi:hypothetical protein